MVDREEALAIVEGKAHWKARLGKEFKSGPGRLIIERIPNQARERLRRTLRAWRHPGGEDSASDAFRYVTPEQLSVQMCDFQLPIEKAQRVLGYDPIPFDEATRRTGAWLQANGYAAAEGASPNSLELA